MGNQLVEIGSGLVQQVRQVPLHVAGGLSARCSPVNTGDGEIENQAFPCDEIVECLPVIFWVWDSQRSRPLSSVVPCEWFYIPFGNVWLSVMSFR